MPLLFNIILEVLARAIRQEIKGIQIRKEEVKLFADDMILYREKLKDSTKELLAITIKYSEVARYKINIQKCVMFLYANDELAEREIKKIIPFTIATKGIKYLGINLTMRCKT